MKGGEKPLKKVAVVTLGLALLMLVVAVAPAVSAKQNGPTTFEVEGFATGYGWFGTVTIGEEEYNGIWVTLFLDARGGELFVDAKNVNFFELWYIGPDIQYDGGLITGTVLLAGFDGGVTRISNSEFCGNGKVTWADGAWSDLMGHREHCSGTVDFSAMTFTATMQIS